MTKYLKTFCCCCMFEQKRINPATFDEHSFRYYSCFGTIHVTHNLIILSALKTIFLFFFLLAKVLSNVAPLGILSAVFIFSTVCITNLLITAGVRLKRYIFLIPYFTVCVLTIFALILHLFIDFLDTANSKNTIEMEQIVHNSILLFLICFEVYMLTIVWRSFVYICDYNMQVAVERIERKKTMVKESIDVEYDLIRNQIIQEYYRTNKEEFV
ncbi:unnamed protein product [Caenorhabditis bovis]|uniref:Uncharacterized protein n=1 Tax=Caenorhabditis bovis TaxID=2654633 RepID=A0A8S1F5G9_9PELO|nr:unnamed protein product [Caenorhabditis bovis]